MRVGWTAGDKIKYMKMTTSTLMRYAGLSAVLAGLCFILVGLFHPVNVPEAVTTDTWVNVHIVAMLMTVFGAIGLTGLYIRQIDRFGWLGLAGFVMLNIWFALVLCFSFVESFILPAVATELPVFVEGFLGMFSSIPSAIDLGILPTLWLISGPLYILGQLSFGIATFRAGIFPQKAGALLALSGIMTPMGGFVPPEHQPLVMLPIGFAFCWLGYTLWSERRSAQ